MIVLFFFPNNHVRTLDSKKSFIKRPTSDTSSDNKRYSERQRVTTNDNEWQRMVILAIFSFFFEKEPTTMHPNDNALNIEVDLEERLLN